jgi:hypothetical protein
MGKTQGTGEAVATLPPIKRGAKLDPVRKALVRRIVEVAQQAKDFEHLGQGQIRIMPSNLAPGNPQCGCGCSCC